MKKQYNEQVNNLKEESSRNINEIKIIVDQSCRQMESFITKDQLKKVLTAANGNSGEHCHYYTWWDSGHSGSADTRMGGNGYFYDYENAITAIPK